MFSLEVLLQTSNSASVSGENGKSLALGWNVPLVVGGGLVSGGSCCCVGSGGGSSGCVGGRGVEGVEVLVGEVRGVDDVSVLVGERCGVGDEAVLGWGREDWGGPVPVAPDPDGDSTPAASFRACFPFLLASCLASCLALY